MQTIFPLTFIGLGDGAGEALAPQIREKYFRAHHVKFRNFINFSYIYFRVKMFCLPQVDELLCTDMLTLDLSIVHHGTG